MLIYLKVDEEQQAFIETNTKEQFDSELYKSERKNRLTSSNFGAVLKRRKSTSCHGLVKQILYGGNFHTEATVYGKIMEASAISWLEKEINVCVEKSGLFVDREYGCLAASPDGK